MNIIKRLFKYFSLALILLILVFIGLWLINSPANLDESSASYSRLNKLNYSFTKIPLSLNDSSRPTPALGSFKGSNNRVLNGSIWLPDAETDKALPLIIYSHGFSGDHNESSHLLEYLASNGYIVASVNFPLSSRRSPVKVPQLLDVVNQPEDVSAIIDHLLKLNNDSNSSLHQRVDINKIGALGLSLGGLTTALASYHPDFTDSRIKSAVMMAPPLAAFNQKFYATNTKIQSLLISGSLDRVVPEQHNATEVMQRNPNGWHVSFNKGTHLGFADIGNPLRWTANPDNLGCSLMNIMLSKLDLPESWSSVIPNTGGIFRNVTLGPPCPELLGKSMNGLHQQWLTRITVGSFFDMSLKSKEQAQIANDFFTKKLSNENINVHVVQPN